MAITRQQKDFTFDYAMRLKDAGLVAASAAAQVGGVDKIIDLGGSSRLDARVIIDFSAIEAASNDEYYIISIQGSDSATFGGTTHTNLGSCVVGDPTKTGEGVDSTAASRRELHFCNEVNGHVFRYLRIYTFVGGTIATGVNYTANLVQHV
jgi:hypothetical protein